MVTSRLELIYVIGLEGGWMSMWLLDDEGPKSNSN
jgi:hypothetical protein